MITCDLKAAVDIKGSCSQILSVGIKNACFVFVRSLIVRDGYRCNAVNDRSDAACCFLVIRKLYGNFVTDIKSCNA